MEYEDPVTHELAEQLLAEIREHRSSDGLSCSILRHCVSEAAGQVVVVGDPVLVLYDHSSLFRGCEYIDPARSGGDLRAFEFEGSELTHFAEVCEAFCERRSESACFAAACRSGRIEFELTHRRGCHRAWPFRHFVRIRLSGVWRVG
jgi:hypothetical protein